MCSFDDTKNYASVFVPKLKIPIEAFITELIIENKIRWKSKTGGPINKPLVPFWRKSVYSKNPELKKIAEEYGLEISYVKNLLKIFSDETVLEYVKEKGIITFRFLPLDKQKAVIYNLFQKELNLKNDKKQKAKIVSLPTEITFKRPDKTQDII